MPRDPLPLLAVISMITVVVVEQRQRAEHAIGVHDRASSTRNHFEKTTQPKSAELKACFGDEQHVIEATGIRIEANCWVTRIRMSVECDHIACLGPGSNIVGHGVNTSRIDALV